MQYGLLKQCLIFLLPPLPTLTHSYPSPCEQALLPEAEEEDGSIEPSSTSAPTAENLTLFLPFELSEKVLQYLSPWDLCQFSGVCLQYREVANSDRLWYAIILSDETLFFLLMPVFRSLSPVQRGCQLRLFVAPNDYIKSD